MDKEDIQLDDLYRILFGEAPPEFLLEVFIRTLIIYLVFLIVMRWLGKRMAGQLTITEFGVMLTLGAIIAPAFQEPGKGILMGIFVLFLILLFQRTLTFYNFKNEKFEKMTHGSVVPLVEDGVLKLKEMKKSRITRQQVYAILRKSEIFNLGEVERLYVEACGEFSLYKAENKKPGLPIYPPKDEGINIDEPKPEKTRMACCSCGNINKGKETTPCEVCYSNNWIKAII